MGLLYQVVYAGTRFSRQSSERRSIVLANVVSLVMTLLSIVFMILYYLWYGDNVVTYSIPVVPAICLLIPVLNFFGYTLASRMILCLFMPILVMAMSLYSKSVYIYRQEELDYFSFRFFILASGVFPPVFFSLREKTWLILTMGIGLTILMLHDPLHNLLGVGYSGSRLKYGSYSFTNIVILITYCIMVGSVVFLKWVIERNEARTEKLIGDLNVINLELIDKNAEIEAQNLEIAAQAENLNQSQQHLQQAYSMIEAQKDLLLQKNENLSTALLEKNQDLTDTNAELIKHNNELRQFSYTVSHNLRGPVASLLGLLQLLDNVNSVEAPADIIHHIRASAQRLDVVIKDLSKIIDIRHDIFRIRQKLSLHQELQDVTQALQRELDLHQVVIEKDLACTTIYSVKPMVHSILYNLVSNAVKYRSPERTPHITVSTRESATHYILQVTDNGLGIDLQHHRDNLFKLYKRFHFHTEGKGLGLYLVKLQAEALGGTVHVQSDMNRYTTFTVSLRKPENVQQQMLLRETYAEMFFDARLNCIGTRWYGPVTGAQYRNAFLKCLEFVKAYNTPNYLADITAQGPIDAVDQQWMFETVLPEAARNGLVRIALVQPDASDTRIATYIQLLGQQLASLGMTIYWSTSPEAAMDWIQEENEKATLKFTYT